MNDLEDYVFLNGTFPFCAIGLPKTKTSSQSKKDGRFYE